jgi:hypothetical protein
MAWRRGKMTFDKWFTEQFGKEPYPQLSLNQMWEERDSIALRLSEIKLKIKKREEWIDRRNATFYAWNLRDKDKK